GLDRVVTGPDPGGADLGGAERVEVGTGDPGVGDVRVPAVAPAGVLALPRVAVDHVAAGVDDLEVVDVAVRLVEHAVAVVVVAVVHVEGGQLGGDLLGGPPGCLLVGHPLVQAVTDQLPHVVADHVVARVAAAPPVAGLVVADLHPVGDGAGDRVGARGLLPGGGLQGRAAGPGVQLLVVLAAEVRLPDRGVVVPAVRLRDLVVHWAVEGGGTGPVGVGVLVGEVGVALVAELD